MTNDEWNECPDIWDMFFELYQNTPKDKLDTLKPYIHRYYLACCKKINYLLPQKAIQEGLQGAEDFLAGKIDRDRLNELDWYAEAECFAFEGNDDEKYIRNIVADVSELQNLPYSEARALMKKAAYFADRAIIFSHLHAPFRTPKDSFFHCPDLLRKFLPAPFDH